MRCVAIKDPLTLRAEAVSSDSIVPSRLAVSGVSRTRRALCLYRRGQPRPSA